MATDVTPPLAELKETMRRAGLRSTAPRLAVLKRLSTAATPVSHRELFEELEALGLDRTTVFRNLADLTGAGLVARTDLGDHVWRFELKRPRNGDQRHHPHFTCTDCGAVACLPEVTLKVRRGQGVPRSLLKQRVEIQLRGLCDRCA